MVIASEATCHAPLETTSDHQTETHLKYKKSKLLPDESDEGSTAESSESEIDDSRSKRRHQTTKHKDYAKHKGKGKNMSLHSESEDSEDSEDSEVEDDDYSLSNFKPPSKTQRRNTKQKATRHNRSTKLSTSRGVRKGRDSPFHAGIKSSSSRAGRQNIQHKRGLKRDRNPYKDQDGSTEESADESSGAEMNVSSSRTSHGRSKRKRLGKPSGLADFSDNDSDMEEETGRRPARAQVKSASVKARSQPGNRKKLDKTNGLAESPDKDLVGGAMDGLTLEGDTPKKNGRTTKTIKHDGKGDSMYEESKGPEEPMEGDSHHV